MTSSKMLILIESLKRVCSKNYDILKSKVTGLSKNEMISFVELQSRGRKVDDVREEDTDIHIAIYNNNWVEYTTVIQFGNGPSKLIEENIRNITNEEVVKLLNDAQIKSYLTFMHRAYKITQDYSKDFDLDLYK